MADWDCEAIIGLMSKIFSLLLCMFTLTLSSCGSWFYCNVSSYGTTPNDKSFYLIPTDSSLIGDLAFEEYANLTKKNSINPDILKVHHPMRLFVLFSTIL